MHLERLCPFCMENVINRFQSICLECDNYYDQLVYDELYIIDPDGSTLSLELEVNKNEIPMENEKEKE